MNMRIGQGFDVHQLVEGRKLIIGGVEVPYEKGLLGHSDADVLLHAICDALLGAAALGGTLPTPMPSSKISTAASCCAKWHTWFVNRAFASVMWMRPSSRKHRKWHRILHTWWRTSLPICASRKAPSM